MSAVARWLLRWYPPRWRQRYELEVAALLEDHATSIATLFDLFLGAIDARLDPTYQQTGGLPLMQRLHSIRLASRVAFWAVPVLFGGYFFAILDRLDGSWDAVRGTASVADTAYALAQTSGGIVGLAVVITSLVVEGARARAVEGMSRKLRHLAAAIGFPLISFGAVQAHDNLLRGMPWDQWLFLVMLGGFLAIPINLGFVIGETDVGNFETWAARVGSIVTGLGMVVFVVGLAVVQAITSAAMPTGSWSTSMIVAFILLLVPTTVAVGGLAVILGWRPPSGLSLSG